MGGLMGGLQYQAPVKPVSQGTNLSSVIPRGPGPATPSLISQPVQIMQEGVMLYGGELPEIVVTNGVADYNAMLASYMATLAGVPYNILDCSGGVSKGIQQINPNFQRTTAQGLYDNWTVPTEDPSAGSLMFYDYQNSDKAIDHVTTILGDGKHMLHASPRGSEIRPTDFIKDTYRGGTSIYYRNVNWNKIIQIK